MIEFTRIDLNKKVAQCVSRIHYVIIIAVIINLEKIAQKNCKMEKKNHEKKYKQKLQ